jgi:hypothetical protein
VHPQVAIAFNQFGVLELRRGHFAEAEEISRAWPISIGRYKTTGAFW